MALLKRADLTRFQRYVEAGDYVPALKLADKFGLDKDDVYKSQWNSSDFGTEAIRDVLSRVEDAMWVVKECKERVCPSREAMNALLSCGLRVTDRYGAFESGTSSLEENATNDKVWWFRFKRLRLLQYKDRLDTFVDINNGRYSQNEYETFRAVSLNKAALGFAERGKTGDVSLLVKRHFYSLAPSILQILGAIPESLSPNLYSQLLPNVAPPKALLPRKLDWVETGETLNAVQSGRKGLFQVEKELSLEDSTEYMVKLTKGVMWPAKAKIVEWYKERARAIDRNCGLLENCLALLDLGVGRGITDLEGYFEDLSDLHGVVYSSQATDSAVDLNLSEWDGLTKYQKFKVILDGASEENVVERLIEQAVPFMIRNDTLAPNLIDGQKRKTLGVDDDMDSQSFLVRWLKEKARENNLLMCSAVLAECCKRQGDQGLFSSDEELVEVVLYCVYAYSETDEWDLMSFMLTRLPRRELRGKESSMVVEDVQGSRKLRKGLMNAFRGAVGGNAGSVHQAVAHPTVNVEESQPVSPRSRDDIYLSETLEAQVIEAEEHIEAGKILLQYKVPKPISFFLGCREDVNGTKQLVRSMTSIKDPPKSDSDWAQLWRNLRFLQEKVFPCLDKEYLLSKLCQEMLKAGKFSLAKNYLKGTGTVILRAEKAEKLVLSAAREYFYSANDLHSSSIAKAKQCLYLLPSSEALTAEIDLINAITENLPDFGVTLLPLQFFKLKDRMEAVKLAISAQPGAYLNIPEIMELGRLLGMSSSEDVSNIEATIAREAAAAGDFILALDMCLGLVKKGHGPIWDLCAALGRGPNFDHMDLETRKELLGFALGHSDEHSVGELLNAWVEFDVSSSCDELGRSVGKPLLSLGDYETDSASLSKLLDSQNDPNSPDKQGQSESCWQGGRQALSCVLADNSRPIEQIWESFTRENKKALGFVCLHVPWLLEVTDGKVELVDVEGNGCLKGSWGHCEPKECQKASAQAVALILYGLASKDIIANDSLVLRLAQEAMSHPVSEEGDMIGCGYLLNLSNSRLGAELLEMELKRREDQEEAHQALEWALSFSTLQASILGLQNPRGRRNVLRETLKGRKSACQANHFQDGSENFWSEFSIKAVETLRVAEESRRLLMVLPDVDAGRFLARDNAYIREKVFSKIDSIKMRPENILPSLLSLGEQYQMEQWQIYERYFLVLLKADWMTEDEVMAEIAGYGTRFLLSLDRLPDAVEAYTKVAGTALEGLTKEGSASSSDWSVSLPKRTLVRALVSLSSDTRVKEDAVSTELPDVNASSMLYRVRHSVWEQLCHFAEDFQAPLNSRIFVLELLEAIRCGRVPQQRFWNSDKRKDEELMISWGKWEAEGGSMASLKQQVESSGEGSGNVGNSINILVALRSTHLISTLWPGWEVKSTDVSSLEAALLFFDRLLGTTTSVGHAKVLKALLEEWEAGLGFDHLQGDAGKDKTVSGDKWEDSAGDDGGEGWEEFHENNWEVHNLHSCWKSTLLKLTELGGVREALSVLDAALLHPTSVLITEEEAGDTVSFIGRSNPSGALQLSLLLPYNSAQVQALKLLEGNLKRMSKWSGRPVQQLETHVGDEDTILQRRLEDGTGVNQDLMALILSSGMLPFTATDPSLTMVFSALCGSLWDLALQVQELHLSRRPSVSEFVVSTDNVPFCVVAFPFFIAEMTTSRCYGEAGALVLQFMRVHPTLATRNAAPMALQRYLRTQADGASVDLVRERSNHYLGKQANLLHLDHLKNTVQSLSCRLEEVLKSALKNLSKDMK